MRRQQLQLPLLAGVLLCTWACGGAGRAIAPAQYQPAESLLTIVAEFQRHRDADLYRFPYPRDVSQQNVFKATLVRLRNYETLNPKKYRELLAFTRAQAYARLGEYLTAVRFAKEAESYGGDLKAKAAETTRIVEDFQQAASLPESAAGLAEFRKALEDRITRTQLLASRYKAEPWRSLALTESERAEVDLVEFLWANRQVIADGSQRAVDRLEALRNRHKESKNYHRHTMRLGDWALEMATEYAILFPPERGLFSWEEFQRWTARAKDLFLEVAQSFGAEERTEAAAKLAAVEALEERVRAASS
jgi:hypothetical protein